LRKREWVQGVDISTAAFIADKNSRKHRDSEGFKPPGTDISIDWEDDETVVDKNLRADTSRFGAARVSLAQIDIINRMTSDGPNAIFPERRATKKNTHHGNLVFLDHVGDLKQKALAGALAAGAVFVPPSRDE
jgi:hypothetical protein